MESGWTPGSRPTIELGRSVTSCPFKPLQDRMKQIKVALEAPEAEASEEETEGVWKGVGRCGCTGCVFVVVGE